MKHKHTQNIITPEWTAFWAGMAFICAHVPGFASDGYPSDYHVISGQSIKRPAPVRLKRPYKPIIPTRVNPKAQSQPVQKAGPMVLEPSYATFVPTNASTQSEPVITSFNPYVTESGSASQPEPAPSWGYTSDESVNATIAPPPLPESDPTPVVAEAEPEPKPVVKKSTPKKSSSRSRYSSYSRRSSGGCKT